MSNPAIKLLVNTDIGSNNLRIEDNLGESIHIHLGVLRIEMSVSDFENLETVVMGCTRNILSEEEIKLLMNNPYKILDDKWQLSFIPDKSGNGGKTSGIARVLRLHLKKNVFLRQIYKNLKYLFKSTIDQNKKINFQSFIDYLNESAQYCIVENVIKDRIFDEDYSEIIVKEDKYEEVIGFLNNNAVVNNINPYDDYDNLYSLDKPIIYDLSDRTVVVYSKMYCMSLFEKAILPLDSYVQSCLWNTLNGHNMSAEVVYIYFVTKYIMNRWVLNNDDIEFLNKNLCLLDSEMVRTGLEREFFMYTTQLTDSLNKKEYVKAAENIVTNRDY